MGSFFRVGERGRGAYLGEGAAEEPVKDLLDLVDAEALLEVGDGAAEVGDQRALLLGCGIVSRNISFRAKGASSYG